MRKRKKENTIAGSLAWKFSERVLSQGVSFVISLVLARLLSPDDYGIIALVLVFINLASVFINSGFSTSLVQKKDADEVDFSTIFYCSSVCSIIIYCVIFLTSPLIASFYEIPELTSVLRVFALQVPLSVYNSIQNAYISKKMIFEKSFAATLIATIISGGIGILMALMGCGVWALVAQSMSMVVASTIVLMFMVPWYPCLKFSWKSARSMMQYGSKILFADLSGTFFGEVRSLIVGKVYTSADLAYYTKGQQVPTLITNNLSATIISVLFPAIANISDDISKVKEFTRRSVQIMSYVMFPVLFGLAAVMEPLVVLVYTDKWRECIPFGQLLCIGLSLGMIGIISLQTLKAIGRSDVVLGLEIWKKPVYVILLVIGVKISVLAVAITMVVYEVYGLSINMIQMNKYVNYKLKEQLKDILPQLLISTVMAVVVYMIPSFDSLLLTLGLKVSVGIVVYLLQSVLFKIHAFRIVIDMAKEMMKK